MKKWYIEFQKANMKLKEVINLCPDTEKQELLPLVDSERLGAANSKLVAMLEEFDNRLINKRLQQPAEDALGAIGKQAIETRRLFYDFYEKQKNGILASIVPATESLSPDDTDNVTNKLQEWLGSLSPAVDAIYNDIKTLFDKITHNSAIYAHPLLSLSSHRDQMLGDIRLLAQENKTLGDIRSQARVSDVSVLFADPQSEEERRDDARQPAPR